MRPRYVQCSQTLKLQISLIINTRFHKLLWAIRIQEGSIKQGTFFLPGAIFRLRSSDLINPAKASVRGPVRLWGHGLGALLILL